MPLPIIRSLLRRELASLRREVEAYPDDDSLWRAAPGIANAGGTLVLHLTGNLDHFVGAVLGGTGFVRDRDAEFARTGPSRAELVAAIEATSATVDATLAALDPARLDEPFPVPVAGSTLPTRAFLMHLASHLAYHLGQIDYHRRIVVGDDRAVGTLAIAELLPPGD